MKPRATYRLQLHKDFTFQDAARQAGYLAALGISHVYTSPILTARVGSKHGYDVIDHSQINPELGGEAAFREMAAAFRAHQLGLIVDIVPNHMAVGRADNPWWQDLLQCGPASRYADTFDIDWDTPGFEGKVVAPFLDGSAKDLIERGDLHLETDRGTWSFGYFDHRFPLRSQDQELDWSAATSQDVLELLGRQHFALLDWRQADDKINWRRFFDITDLAAIRVGSPTVFQRVHAKILDLYGEGLIDGVRVDHIDGIADPRDYCLRLRQALDEFRPGAYIVVEKILADGEPLPDWSVDGTTGYDAMNELSAILHQDDQGALENFWQEYTGRNRSFDQEEIEARQELLRTKFAAQFGSVTRAFGNLLPNHPVGEALAQTIAHLRCYRSYATGQEGSPGPGAPLLGAMRQAGANRSDLQPVLTALGELFASVAGDPAIVDALRRFHQLSAPIAAKAVEDTAFYRYGRLISRNDVGFDPRRLTFEGTAFHERVQARSQRLPHAMLATATHDHKRGEDTRARLAALSHHVASWTAFAKSCPLPSGIDAADFYFLLQTLVGAWPAEGADETFSERIGQWGEKYLREAKLRSSWAAPAKAYETSFKALARTLCLEPEGQAFRSNLQGLLREIAPQAKANSHLQTVLHYTLPGVPDLYQGCEFTDLSLVDPDNRRPVDYAARAAALTEHGDAKQELIASLLSLRASNPKLWTHSSYEPLQIAEGNALFGFWRRFEGASLLTLICRSVGAPVGDTVLLDTAFSDVLTGAVHGPGEIAASVILGNRPATVLYGCKL